MKKVLLILSINLIIIGCDNHNKVDGVYRYFMGKEQNYNIWIVDGNQVRLKIFSSFKYGGNEQRYPFNPKGEIWIDGQVSCEETEYSITTELKERELLGKGKSNDDAYSDAIDITLKLREDMTKLAESHFRVAIPDSITRYAGTIDPYEK